MDTVSRRVISLDVPGDCPEVDAEEASREESSRERDGADFGSAAIGSESKHFPLRRIEHRHVPLFANASREDRPILAWACTASSQCLDDAGATDNAGEGPGAEVIGNEMCSSVRDQFAIGPDLTSWRSFRGAAEGLSHVEHQRWQRREIFRRHDRLNRWGSS